MVNSVPGGASAGRLTTMSLRPRMRKNRSDPSSREVTECTRSDSASCSVSDLSGASFTRTARRTVASIQHPSRVGRAPSDSRPTPRGSNEASTS